MIKILIARLRGLLSGGSVYIILALLGALSFQHLKITHVKSKLGEVTSAKDRALEEIREKNGVIAAQTQQFTRRVQSQEAQDNAETIIASVPDSSECNGSMPVRGALDWLREHQDPNSKTHND